MKVFKSVKSAIKPDDFLDSGTAIFIRSNIKEQDELDPVFNTTSTIYTYDETEYTYPEWFNFNIETLTTENSKLKDQVKTLQLVISQLISILSVVPTPGDQKSQIYTMYVQMINNNIITLESVPDVFKDNVKKILDA